MVSLAESVLLGKWAWHDPLNCPAPYHFPKDGGGEGGGAHKKDTDCRGTQWESHLGNFKGRKWGKEV